MKTFWFYDTRTFEDFLVEAPMKKDAVAVAKKYFKSPIFINEVTFDEAEELGFDTY